MNETPTTHGVPAAERRLRWLNYLIKGAVLTAAFLVPILHLPLTTDFLYIKVILIELGAVIALGAWLLKVFFEKKIEYKRSPVNLALFLLAAVLILSSIFSFYRGLTFWGLDPTGEKTATLFSLAVLAFLISAVFSEEDGRRLGKVLLASFFVLSVLAAAVMFGGNSLPAFLRVNPVGTVNALAILLTIGFVFSFGLAGSATAVSGSATAAAVAEPEFKRLNSLKFFAGVTAALSFADLLLLNSQSAWIALSAAMAVYIAFSVSKSRFRQACWSQGALATAFLALAVSLFMLLAKPTFTAKFYQPPIEVSPSFSSTFNIGWRILSQGRVLGSGPATFLMDYNRYRDQSLNATPFWTVRFAHGFSFFATMLATLGIIGLLVFLFFAVVSLTAYGRGVWLSPHAPFAWAAFGAGATIFISWFFYASSLTENFLLFILVGFLGSMIQEPKEILAGAGETVVSTGGVMKDAEGFSAAGGTRRGFREYFMFWRRRKETPRSWWRINRQSLEFAAPGLDFIVSLVVVSLAALSLVAIYFLITQYTAEAAYASGVAVVNTSGNIDEASSRFSRAAELNPADDRYPNAIAQVSLLKLQAVIQQAAASPSPDLQNQFRNVLSTGVTAAQQASALNPANPSNWAVLGQLFETVTPFLAGADQASLNAYRRAEDDDSLNPVYSFSQGRVLLTAADILTLQINQTSSGDERGRLEVIRQDEYRQAQESLERSLKLKPDYAQAHFLLAELAIRENNLSEAVRKTEDTVRLAPTDIGVAFQLGVLYYRANRLDEAKNEFERAVLLNDNYSNARYFLGLVWDRKGDRDAALSQFVKVAALNPDNQEVKRIVANLQAGRHALLGIVPPAPAPEVRKEAPLRERGEETIPLRQH